MGTPVTSTRFLSIVTRKCGRWVHVFAAFTPYVMRLWPNGLARGIIGPAPGNTGRKVGEEANAERTKRADSPGGRDRQCGSHSPDRDRRDRRDDVEATGEARERFGGGESTSREHHRGPAPRDRGARRRSTVGLMTNGVLSVAKKFGEIGDWRFTNLELNKLAYLAHMIRLGESGGAAGLVTNTFEAWDYGPVSPRLYHAAKAFGSRPVANIFHQYADITDAADVDAIMRTAKMLEGKKPGDLVAITHWRDGAWYQNYEPGAKGIVISDRDIYGEYLKRAGQQRAA